MILSTSAPRDNFIPNITMVPEELKGLKQWVCYNYPDKIPYNPVTNQRAKSNDTSTWVSFYDALTGIKSGKYNGIGFQLTKPYVCIDYDHVYDPDTGIIDREIIKEIQNLNSYTEISPSGRGIHVIVKGDIPVRGKKKGNIEIYQEKRYITVTGNVVEGFPLIINEAQDPLNKLFLKRFGELKPELSYTGNNFQTLLDEDVITRASTGQSGIKFKRLWQGDITGYTTDSEADQALISILSCITQDGEQIKRIILDSGIRRDKWNRPDYLDRCINKAIATVNLPNGDNSEGIYNEAIGILTRGNPLEYMTSTFASDHIGDRIAATDMACTCISSVIANSEGLHTFLSAESGAGKTHSADTFMKKIPEEWKMVGTFSDKYLYYAGEASNAGEQLLKPGMVVVVDDHTFNEGVQEIFKTSISHWKEGIGYGTVKNQGAKRLSIPKRISWILMKVDDPGDDQVMNRLNQVHIDETEEQRQKTIDLIKQKYSDVVNQTVVEERYEVRVCREMWRLLKDQFISIDIPWAKEVNFQDNNYRNIERFYAFVMANSALNMHQRPLIGKSQDGIPVIQAVKADFLAAKEHYSELFKTGAQSYNLVTKESAVIEAILKLNPPDGRFTIKEIQQTCKSLGNPMNDQSIRRAIGGRKSSKDSEALGGLIRKCPYITLVGNSTTYETEEDITYKDENSRCIEVRKRGSQNQTEYYADIDALRLWYRQGEPMSINPDYQWVGSDTLPCYHCFSTSLPNRGNNTNLTNSRVDLQNN